jgi:hypothetical protein
MRLAVKAVELSGVLEQIAMVALVVLEQIAMVALVVLEQRQGDVKTEAWLKRLIDSATNISPSLNSLRSRAGCDPLLYATLFRNEPPTH